MKKLIGRFKARKGLFKRFFRREAFWLSIKGLVLLLVSILLIWLFWAAITAISYSKLEHAAQAGDKFGGITALFSGLAFAGLIYTLFVQKKELEYQRKELARLVDETEGTKTHLEAQAKHLQSQAKSLEKQNFETTFFQLLSNFSEFVRSLDTDVMQLSGDGKHQGSDALIVFRERLRPSRYKKRSRSRRQSSEKKPLGSVNVVSEYESNFENEKEDLAPLFRIIYHILKFLERSKIDDKPFYANQLRAMLNSSTLTLLALNCASRHGKDRMAPLVKKFNLLKHYDDFELLCAVEFDQSMAQFYGEWDFYTSALDRGLLEPTLHD